MSNPAVDYSTEFHAYAMKKTNGEFEPWAYHPRKLGEEDVEVKISHCGICASDLHTAFQEWGPVELPVVVGHEIVGVVTAAGSKSSLKVGDRVGVGAQVFSCLNRHNENCSRCKADHTPHCTKGVLTYHSKYVDGEVSKGGYADRIRVDSNFAFKLPENLESANAAPLLCAGITVYTPLKQHNVTKGTRVGVIGIGGLGHLAVQFAHKLGADVTAIGTSKSKADLAKKLGASHYVDSSDPESIKKAAQSLDLIICTANANGMPWDQYFSLLDFQGTLVILGVPPEGKLPVSTRGLIFSKWNVTGSLIGGPETIKEMLQFAADNKVTAMIEELPMAKVNEGIQKVKDNNVKFRVVLKN